MSGTSIVKVKLPGKINKHIESALISTIRLRRY